MVQVLQFESLFYMCITMNDDIYFLLKLHLHCSIYYYMYSGVEDLFNTLSFSRSTVVSFVGQVIWHREPSDVNVCVCVGGGGWCH